MFNNKSNVLIYKKDQERLINDIIKVYTFNLEISLFDENNLFESFNR